MTVTSLLEMALSEPIKLFLKNTTTQFLSTLQYKDLLPPVRDKTIFMLSPEETLSVLIYSPCLCFH